MTTNLITTSRGLIEYSLYGKGDPVLFLHGGHSNARETLAHKYMDPEKFTLITPSRPGYGRTPLSGNTTPEAAADQIAELMEKLGFEHYHIIGISAGGPTAIALASRHPQRLRKLVLESAVTKRWLSPDDELYRRGKRMFSPGVERFTWGLLRVFLRLFPRMIVRQMADELTTVDIPHFKPEEIEDMRRMLLIQRSGSGFVTDLEHELDEEVIAAVKAPTLIVHSKNDKAVGKEHPLYAKEKIDNARILWVDNQWGHLIWMGEKAEDVIREVKAFLRE